MRWATNAATAAARSAIPSTGAATPCTTTDRHPSYVAGLLLHAGIALALTNWGSLAIALLGAPPLFVYRIRVEERALLERLGAPYAAYMSRTSRLVYGVW